MSAAAAEAARLGPLDAWAMIALGCCRLIVRDHAGALAELRAAVEAEPCATLGHGTLALALAFAGETEEALAAAAQARRINPYDPRGVVALNAEGVACILSGRYAQGLAAGNRLAALQPGYPSGPGIAAAIRGPRRYRGGGYRPPARDSAGPHRRASDKRTPVRLRGTHVVLCSPPPASRSSTRE